MDNNNSSSSSIRTFAIFNQFVTLHPDVDMNEEVPDLAEAFKYYQRLEVKNMQIIEQVLCSTNYKQLYAIASQLQIDGYSALPLSTLRSVIRDKLNVVFGARRRRSRSNNSDKYAEEFNEWFEYCK